MHFFGPYPYRSSFWSTTPEQESERALQHLEQVIQFEGPGTIAAILLESVVGTAGVLIPPPGYMEGVRALCDTYGIVFIADEVMAGFGRTGKWFAFEHFNVTPDLITFAKGSNSGYVPVGGVIISDAIAATFDDRVFPGGLTYSGHPLAAASIVGVDRRHEGGGHRRERGAHRRERPRARACASWPSGTPSSARCAAWASSGRSTSSRTARRASRSRPYGGTSPAMAELGAEMKKRGAMPFMNFNRLHVVPPCTITEAEAKEGLAILDDAFAVIDKHYQG